MDPQEDLIERDITLTVLIPGGQETTATVHGSKPVMDVLVTLCAQHHLVPSDHVIKLISTNQNHINFKPNSMIGSLEFEKVVLQVKGSDANKKKPHIPVATVRLLINYKKSYKAVVRVNPAVPLAELMPTVCEKCEFHPDATVLLRTDQSEEPLDLSKTLNDYAIRELYAKEVKVVPTNPPVDPLSTHKGADEEQKTSMKEKKHSEKGNKGFFGLFKKSTKASEQAATDTAPDSPQLNGQHSDRVNGANGHSVLPMIPADLPKKRRAPQPPMTASQSIASGLHTRDFSDLSESDPAGKEGPLNRISSTESSLKRTKRRAPPPPLYGLAPPDSDNKEEEAQRGHRSSQKCKARIANHCPQIEKVMSELTKSLRARKQRMLSSANSSVSQNSSEGPYTPEAELKALPVCQLSRQASEREGLTTFTVVPQRRPQTEPVTSQTAHTDRAEEYLCPGDPEDLESPTTEAIPTELFTNGGSSSDEYENVSEVLHLEKKRQVWMKVKNENLEPNEEEYNNPINLPVCGLQRKFSEREGFTTFTVIPQRRQQSFGEPVSSQSADTGEAEAHVCPGDPEALERPSTEPGEAIPTELFRNGGSSSDEYEDVSEVLHLEKERQVWMKVKNENLEPNEEEYINPKNTEIKTLPDCGLQRKSSEREGFTTFTVVPQRRQQSFEKPVSSQSAETGEAEAHMCPGDPEALERPSTEPGEAIPTELFNYGDHSSLENELSIDVLVRERQAWMDVKSKNEDECVNINNTEFKALPVCEQLREGFTAFTVVPQMRPSENVDVSDEEDQCIYTKNTQLKRSESPQSSLQHLGSEMDDHLCDGPLKSGIRSPDSNAGLVKREETEDDVLVEAGEEKDWIEEYNERRRKFLGGSNACMKELDVWGRIQRELTNTQEENTIDQMVCCNENSRENEENEKMLTCDEVNLNLALRISSKPKFVSFSDYAKPNAHTTLNNAESNASGAQSNCRFAPELHRTSVLSHSDSSFDPCPPAQVSLFALAVFQKAKRSKPGPDPNCSRRGQLPVNTLSN